MPHWPRKLLEFAAAPQRLTEIGLSGAKSVAEKFDQQQQVRKLEDYYFEALSRLSPKRGEVTNGSGYVNAEKKSRSRFAITSKPHCSLARFWELAITRS